jgi:hypothetical protein
MEAKSKPSENYDRHGPVDPHHHAEHDHFAAAVMITKIHHRINHHGSIDLSRHKATTIFSCFPLFGWSIIWEVSRAHSVSFVVHTAGVEFSGRAELRLGWVWAWEQGQGPRIWRWNQTICVIGGAHDMGRNLAVAVASNTL